MDHGWRRWLILAGYWVFQAVFLVAGATLFYGSTANGHWELAPLDEYLRAPFSGDLFPYVAVSVPVLTGLQLLLVLPVRLRTRPGGRGKSVYVALGAGGAMIAVLVVAFGAAVAQVPAEYDLVTPSRWSETLILCGLGLSWSVFTVLLVRYARRSTLADHDLLTRVARGIFAGTVIETAALIPIDVMLRRKASCYCWSASLVALIVSGAIGVVVAGPAVFLPLVARRPAWLKAGRCAWCGYDRAGLGPGSACPECGNSPPAGDA